MCNWFQNKSPTHTFAVDCETWHCKWAAPCYFNGASPTGSLRWGYCLQWHLACEGLYGPWHENAFRIIVPLWGEYINHQLIPLITAQSYEHCVFLCCKSEQAVEQTTSVCWFEMPWHSYDATVIALILFKERCILQSSFDDRPCQVAVFGNNQSPWIIHA